MISTATLCTIDWQAVATAVTGVLAVGAAVYVGRRQTKIADRQTKILDRQSAIEGQKLKADLFERRLATFEATADFITRFQDYGRDQHAEGRVVFFQKLRESQFLFGPSVHDSLMTILDRAQGVWMAQDVMRSDHAHDFPRDAANSQKALDGSIWLLNRLETLAEVFAPYLRLDDLTEEVTIDQPNPPPVPIRDVSAPPPKRRTRPRFDSDTSQFNG